MKWKSVAQFMLLYCATCCALLFVTHYSSLLEIKKSFLQSAHKLYREGLAGEEDDWRQLQKLSETLPDKIGSLSYETLPGYSLIRSASVREVSFKHEQPGNDWNSFSFPLTFYEGKIYVRVTLERHLNLWLLLSISVFISLVIWAIYRLLPGDMNLGKWLRFGQFVELGYGNKQALKLASESELPEKDMLWVKKISQTTHMTLQEAQEIMRRDDVLGLTPAQLDWFVLALKREYTVSESLGIALHPESLEFDLDNMRVLIHGIPIQLPKTPMLYYFWYAEKKKQGEMYYLNPHAKKPDREQGEYLAGLMERYGGHGRAINDLLEVGLKSKTLDQNRNKIRDELIGSLGELAQDYLFVSERDNQANRNKYGVVTPDDRIKLSPDLAGKVAV